MQTCYWRDLGRNCWVGWEHDWSAHPPPNWCPPGSRWIAHIASWCILPREDDPSLAHNPLPLSLARAGWRKNCHCWRLPALLAFWNKMPTSEIYHTEADENPHSEKISVRYSGYIPRDKTVTFLTEVLRSEVYEDWYFCLVRRLSCFIGVMHSSKQLKNNHIQDEMSKLRRYLSKEVFNAPEQKKTMITYHIIYNLDCSVNYCFNINSRIPYDCRSPHF